MTSREQTRRSDFVGDVTRAEALQRRDDVTPAWGNYTKRRARHRRRHAATRRWRHAPRRPRLTRVWSSPDPTLPGRSKLKK